MLDGALPDPDGVRARLLARTDWVQGAPVRPESWPGQRTKPALDDAELAPLCAWAARQLGAKKVRGPDRPDTDHNCAQLVGAGESSVRPHTDARSLCAYAGVLYLTPGLPADCGTSFFRMRLPDGRLGGNTLPPGVENLVQALGTRHVPLELFVEEVRVEARYNRLILYPADLIHSATRYCGRTREEKRLTTVFFWHR